MKAEDTIIKTTDYNCHNTLEERLSEQAKVSFKAGYEERDEEARKAGMKEVINWIESSAKKHFAYPDAIAKPQFVGFELLILRDDWYKKLKEWGMWGPNP